MGKSNPTTAAPTQPTPSGKPTTTASIDQTMAWNTLQQSMLKNANNNLVDNVRKEYEKAIKDWYASNPGQTPSKQIYSDLAGQAYTAIAGGTGSGAAFTANADDQPSTLTTSSGGSNSTSTSQGLTLASSGGAQVLTTKQKGFYQDDPMASAGMRKAGGLQDAANVVIAALTGQKDTVGNNVDKYIAERNQIVSDYNKTLALDDIDMNYTAPNISAGNQSSTSTNKTWNSTVAPNPNAAQSQAAYNTIDPNSAAGQALATQGNKYVAMLKNAGVGLSNGVVSVNNKNDSNYIKMLNKLEQLEKTGDAVAGDLLRTLLDAKTK